MSNPGKSGVVATRWWWVRHAPVRSDGGNIYGQKDIACDTSDREVFEAVAKILPRGAVWYASTLQRTHQTADAIWAAGLPRPSSMPHEAAFAEQHLGQWQGMNRAAFLASRPIGSHWFADIDQPAPGGESFMDLYRRVCAAIGRINVEQAGNDVIAVAHGGTIKAASGLRSAVNPKKASPSTSTIVR
jgi:alpha-ribazole phosphatase